MGGKLCAGCAWVVRKVCAGGGLGPQDADLPAVPGEPIPGEPHVRTCTHACANCDGDGDGNGDDDGNGRDGDGDSMVTAMATRVTATAW